ncbi:MULTISPECIES: DUF2971 domain-containing protein [Photobacterium]|uniref:DUF2971 domain-containing protein n=2 Tax=Vibrionaceae TaxID=641 RepID=UPI001371B3BA|nr:MULTISPECIES: DUF2971 domain-containing protein [Photobacterium]
MNDPLEGRYYSRFGNGFDEKVNIRRNEWRICALSSALDNFLLWSHYASGHKGIAIELEIPEENPDLSKVQYSPFSPIFTDISESIKDHKNLFEIKTEEWSYEQEYRIICKGEFYELPNPIKKIYLGHKISSERAKILRSILPSSVEVVQMKLDSYQGKVVPET